MSMRIRVVMSVLVLCCLALAPAASAGEIGGLWDFVFQTATGERKATFELAVEGDNVTARAGDLELTGTFKGGALELSGEYAAPEAGYSAPLDINGELVEGQLEGDGSWDQQYPFTFTATKQ